MYITINDNETIGTIRKKFSAQFPFLRIDFFRPIGTDIPYSALRIVDEDVELGSFRKLHNAGAIEVSPDMHTRQLEEKFLREFGLHMQIFRRSGNKWLLTTATDEYSLAKQNELGELMSRAVDTEEPIDFHEQD